jgi:hypothetical protein
MSRSALRDWPRLLVAQAFRLRVKLRQTAVAWAEAVRPAIGLDFHLGGYA